MKTYSDSDINVILKILNSGEKKMKCAICREEFSDIEQCTKCLKVVCRKHRLIEAAQVVCANCETKE